LRDAETGLQIGVPPPGIDILRKIKGVSFDQAWKNHIDALIEGDTPACVISRKNLTEQACLGQTAGSSRR
jgi:hypothetical protein